MRLSIPFITFLTTIVAATQDNDASAPRKVPISPYGNPTVGYVSYDQSSPFSFTLPKSKTQRTTIVSNIGPNRVAFLIDYTGTMCAYQDNGLDIGLVDPETCYRLSGRQGPTDCSYDTCEFKWQKDGNACFSVFGATGKPLLGKVCSHTNTTDGGNTLGFGGSYDAAFGVYASNGTLLSNNFTPA